MNFTQDWFTLNIPHLTNLIKLLPEKKSILEIGCFEGKSTCWFLENVLDADGTIVCIDPFTGSEEHKDLNLSDLYKTFNANVSEIAKITQDVKIYAEISYTALARLIIQKEKFDLIYIDGSHHAADVMTDACMAWGLLKSKGIMVFDDYNWNMPNLTYRETPKAAVDRFEQLFDDQFQIVHNDYQVALQKL